MDRCISSDVLLNDNFTSLPNSAKVLYVYLNQHTDNEGFIDTLNSVMAIVKAKPKDLQLLIDREYIYQVKDWLYLEAHFWLNNKNLRPERGKKSRFKKYLVDFEKDENNIYRKLPANCRQNSAECRTKIKENKIKENKLIEKDIEREFESPDEFRAFLRGQ